MAKKKDYIWKDRKHVMWFPFTFTKYCIKNDRLYSDRGFFNTISDELLLYRVVDVTLTRTFGQKIFGTGTVALAAKIDRDSIIYLENIKHPKEVKEMVSSLVETARDEKNVIGREFYGSGNFSVQNVDCDCCPDDDGEV